MKILKVGKVTFEGEDEVVIEGWEADGNAVELFDYVLEWVQKRVIRLDHEHRNRDNQALKS